MEYRHIPENLCPCVPERDAGGSGTQETRGTGLTGRGNIYVWPAFALMKMLCTGNPQIQERMNLELEVSKIKILKADYNSKRYRLEDDLLRHYPAQIQETQNFITGIQSDFETLSQHPHPEDGFAGMEIQGNTYTDRTEAGTALLDA